MTTKGTNSISEYFGRMKTLADEMASAGRKLEDEELVSYILTGLDLDFDPVVSAVTARVEPISVAELYTQLISHEQRLEMRSGDGNQSSANMASRGDRGGSGNRSGGGGRGGSGGSGHGGYGRGNKGGRGGGGGQRKQPFQPGVYCQVCTKEGHTAIGCFTRFDASYTPPQKSASSATASYGVDTNWYMDTGATDHITSELDKLTMRDKYHGGEQVHTASGSGMEISHIGHGILRSPNTNLQLKHILHVPSASKNLLSVNRITRDNDVFLEFHPDCFLVKEQSTRKTILEGRCEHGLYLVRPPNKEVLGAVKPTTSMWHHRLGHATPAIVHQVLHRHQLPFVKESNNSSVCGACQQGKSHQLPYPRSTSISSSPFDIVFSDVWGPAPNSVARNNYYVSFIDDYSKFVWIYLLRKKSEVFQIFRDF